MKKYLVGLLMLISLSSWAENFRARDNSLGSFNDFSSPDEIIINTDLLRRASGAGANSASNINMDFTQGWSLSNTTQTSLNNMNILNAYASAQCAVATPDNPTADAATISNYCSYISGNFDACTGHGATAQQKCNVDCVIRDSHQNQIQQEMSSLPAGQKQQACIDRVKNVIASAPIKSFDPGQVRSGLMMARVDVLARITSNRNRRQARLDAGSTLGCSESQGDDGCDNFTSTALRDSSISSLASLFSTEYTTNRNGFLYLGTKKDCDKCMKLKFEALSSPSASQESFANQMRALKEQRVVEIAARKANEAISNYLKFSERNDFMARYVGVQKEGCDTLGSLSNLPRSCSLSQKILNKIKSGFDGIGGGSAQSSLREILSKSKEAMFNKTNSCDGDFDFNGFQRSRLTQIGAGDVDPSLWMDGEAEARIQRCEDYNTNCFVQAMAEAYNRKIPSMSVEDAVSNLVSHMAISPYLRTMLSSKTGVLAYKTMPLLPLNGSTTVDQYLETHKQKIWDAAQADLAHSCQSIDRDLRTALCTTGDNIAENYTGEEVRTEIATLINEQVVQGDERALYLNLGAACSILSDAEADLSNTIPQAASMFEPDRAVAAIPFTTGKVAGYDHAVDVFGEIASAYCAAAPTSLFPAPQVSLSSVGSLGGASTVKNCRQSWEPISVSFEYVPLCYSTIPNSGTSSGLFGLDGANLIGSMGRGMYGTSARGNLTQSGYGGIDLSGYPSLSGSGTQLPDNEIVVTGTRPAQTPDNPIPVPESQSALATTQARDQVRTSDVSVAREGSAFIESNTGTAFSAMSGGSAQPGQQIQMRPSGSMNAGSFQPMIQMPQQIEIANNSAGTVVRREETLVRQEAELLRRVDGQSIENRELRDAVAQLRREMSSMATQNAQLLPTLQAMMKSRGAKSVEVEEEELEPDTEAEAPEVAQTPTSRTPKKGRAPASIPSSRTPERTGGVTGGDVVSRSQGGAVSGGAATAGGGVSIAPEVRGSQVVAGPVGAAANITVSGGGARAGSGMERLVTRFTPSNQVTRQVLAAPGGAVAEVGAEEKTQLVLEFLDYVKEYPLYRNGAYLSQSNDTITVDYAGKEVVVRIDQIEDPQTRTLVQERLISQRMNLNQQLRQARLTELRRLLAEASDGL